MQDLKTCLCMWLCVFNLLAILISFPSMAVLLASDYQGKQREK